MTEPCHCTNPNPGLRGRARTVVVHSLDEAAFELALADRDSVGAVHGARKALKKARAAGLLLLEADPSRIGPDLSAMAQAGRLLGPIRDRHVARQLAAAAEPGGASSLAPPPLGPAARNRVVQSSLIVLSVRNHAVDRWHLDGIDDEAVVSSIDAAYRKARLRWRTADRPTGGGFDPEEFHDARKAVKQAHYQVDLLRPAGTAPDERLLALERLGESLGRHHDLAQFDPTSAEIRRLEDEICASARDLFGLRPRQHRAWAVGLLA